MENNSNFALRDFLYRVEQRRVVNSDYEAVAISNDYPPILVRVRDQIKEYHSDELSRAPIGSEEHRARLKSLIMRYINQMKLAGDLPLNALVDKIYSDMAGLGLLDKYLADPTVEEININGSERGQTWVVDATGKHAIPEGFASPEEAFNIIAKAARLGDVILDGSMPYGDSYIYKGVRMSGIINPIVSSDVGAIASIRIQQPSKVTRENVILWETAIAQELDFLSLCLNNGVSVAFAGPTGSGKTADMGMLLSSVPNNTRVVTIEDTAELSLRRVDEHGRSNDVVQLLTRETPNPVTMGDLLRSSMRLHPEILVTAEMRGEEAMTVQEAGRTGHTISTTLHANSAVDAYDRILTMCLMSDTSLSEERLLRNIVSALPIMVFKKQLRDGSRKYMEIIEAVDVVDGRVVANTLYKYVITGREVDEAGNITLFHGRHEKQAEPSAKLLQKLLDEGVDIEVLREFAPNFVAGLPRERGGQ